VPYAVIEPSPIYVLDFSRYAQHTKFLLSLLTERRQRRAISAALAVRVQLDDHNRSTARLHYRRPFWGGFFIFFIAHIQRASGKCQIPFVGSIFTPSRWRDRLESYSVQASSVVGPERLKPPERPSEDDQGLTAATCGSVNGSVRCTTPSAYNLSMAPSDRPSMRARMSVVSSPIDGAPRQIRPGVNDIFGTTP
jgi:hypothetical protein